MMSETESQILTSRGPVGLSHAVDAVLHGIFKMQEHSEKLVKKNKLTVSSGASAPPKTHEANQSTLEILLDSIQGTQRVPFSVSNSFLDQSGPYGRFFTRTIAEIVFYYENDSFTEDMKGQYVRILRDLLLLLATSTDITSRNSIFYSVGVELASNVPLVTSVLTLIYFDVASFYPDLKPKAFDVQKIAFWEVMEPEIGDESVRSMYSAYHELLSLCFVTCVEGSGFTSPLRNSLYELLVACPYVTPRSWGILTQAIFTQSEENEQHLKCIFQSLAILTKRKPAIKEEVLSVMIYCGMCDSTLIKNIALRSVYSYLAFHEIYQLYDVQQEGTKSVLLGQLIRKVADRLIDSVTGLTRNMLEANNDLDPTKTQKYINAIVQSRCSLAFSAENNQTHYVETLLKNWKEFPDQIRPYILTALEKIQEFHETLIDECTSVSFHRLLVTFFSDCENLVEYILKFLASYLNTYKAPGRKNESDWEIFCATERVFVHTICQTIPKSSRKLDLVSCTAKFFRKKEFFELGLPVILSAVAAKEDAVKDLFLRLFLRRGESDPSNITAGDLFLQLNIEPVNEENLLEISHCIDILIRLQPPEPDTVTGQPYILDIESIVGSFKKLSEIQPWPVLTLRTLMQCLEIHTDKLLHWSINTFLPSFVRLEPWKCDVSIWNGIVKVIHKYLPDSMGLLLSLPREIIMSIFEAQPKIREKVVEVFQNGHIDNRQRQILKELLGM